MGVTCLDNHPYVYTMGYCEIEYWLPNSISQRVHISTVNIRYDHFKQFVNEQEAFLLYIELKNPLYLTCKLFCEVIVDEKVLKHANIELEVC